jgi:hypothetical protein
MNERMSPDVGEKLGAGQTMLLAEPIFKVPDQWPGGYAVPVGAESWVSRVENEPRPVDEMLKEEYTAIASGLKKMGVDFRIIVAHKNAVDGEYFANLARSLGLRGLGLDPAINSTTFPRDMMVTFNGVPHINPEANFKPTYTKGIMSPLGEGGRVLKVRGKVFVPTPQYQLDNPKYTRQIRTLERQGFRVGTLPWPPAIDADPQKDIQTVSATSHLDRGAAFIRGKDGGDYLLLDSNYAGASSPMDGEYQLQIEEACERLDVSPIVVERNAESIPYALNFEQFEDGSVFMTGGDPELEATVRGIVGDDKVETTEVPIIQYPIRRKGGIRCMTLVTSNKIVMR